MSWLFSRSMVEHFLEHLREGERDETVHSLQEGVQSEEEGTVPLFGIVRERGEGVDAERLEDRETEEQDSIQTAHKQRRVCDVVRRAPSICGRATNDRGTYSGDGVEDRETNQTRGVRPPHQRSENGQQNREFGTGRLGEALQETHNAISAETDEGCKRKVCVNSRFSRVLVEGYSEASCSDGEPCAPSKSTSTHGMFWSPGRTMDASIRSRSGMTYEPSTDDRGEALLTWFLEGFPARMSASQGKARASTENEADSGPRWLASLARYDRATSSWKTCQPSLLGDSDEFSETWPASGTMRSGACWERTTPALRTGGGGCGSWPTPKASAAGPDYAAHERGKSPSLQTVVAERGMSPTPTVCGNGNHVGASAKSGDGLETRVRQFPTPTVPGAHQVGTMEEWGGSGNLFRKTSKMWPTPRHSPSENRQTGGLSPSQIAGKHGMSLCALVNHIKRDMWPTPIAMDFKSGSVSLDTLESNSRPLREMVGGRLNPDWVELLMGWPLGWTGLGHRVGELSEWIGIDFYGSWQDGSWEAGVTRIAEKCRHRNHRLMCIGNGQVPQTAAMTWSVLFERSKG